MSGVGERLRVGIVGARRANQGLGPFVARWLATLGADVAAFAGTSAETVAVAGRDLERIAGVRARGHVGADAMLAAERLDAVMILSPPAHHGAALDACLAAGVHVLCEKPLLWPDPDPVGRSRALEEGFHARGIVLAENCQWPWVLSSFDALHPGRANVPATFAMGMEPASVGSDMWTDALSHPLSVLQALLGDTLTVEDAEVPPWDHASRALAVDFLARGPRGVTAARVELESVPRQPRRAWLAVDGRRAERWVRLEDYAIFLEDEGRRVQVPDPLEAHLADFLRRAAAPRADGEAPRALSSRMGALAALLEAAERSRRP